MVFSHDSIHRYYCMYGTWSGLKRIRWLDALGRTGTFQNLGRPSEGEEPWRGERDYEQQVGIYLLVSICGRLNCIDDTESCNWWRHLHSDNEAPFHSKSERISRGLHIKKDSWIRGGRDRLWSRVRGVGVVPTRGITRRVRAAVLLKRGEERPTGDSGRQLGRKTTQSRFPPPSPHFPFIKVGNCWTELVLIRFKNQKIINVPILKDYKHYD